MTTRRGLLGALLGAALTPVDAIAKALPAAATLVDPFGQRGVVPWRTFYRPPVMNEYWMREMLRQARPGMLECMGSAQPMPNCTSKTIKFRRYVPLGSKP